MDRLSLRGLLTVLLVVATSGCSGRPLDTTLERLMESLRLSADLLVQLAKTDGAANRAVMADTDEASASFAREADEAAGTIRKEVDALRPTLQALEYGHEAQLLEEFAKRFADYSALDRKILDLAVENSNLKAQRLSFGPASQAADELRDALSGLAPSSPEQAWRVQALATNAIASVREIQALQGPHIAAAEDDAMTALERRMAMAEAAARQALQALAPVVAAPARARVTLALTLLDRFMTLNRELVKLSRRNSNVRSLALSLGQKRMLTAACEESLEAMQNALSLRGIGGTR